MLGKQILMLQQQVTELRSANHVLLQNLPQISDHQRCPSSPERYACLLLQRCDADTSEHCISGPLGRGMQPACMRVHLHISVPVCISWSRKPLGLQYSPLPVQSPLSTAAAWYLPSLPLRRRLCEPFSSLL